MDTFEYRADDLAAEAVIRTACDANDNYTLPDGNSVVFESCDNYQTCDMGRTQTVATGRILDVKTTLCNVCPGRRVALGVTVHERDQAGNEHPRGLRTVTVPAHRQSGCADVTAPVLRFILPEDLDTGRGGRRHFIVRATTHYVDANA